MVAKDGLYARISEDRLRTEAGVDRQLKDARALSKRRGGRVIAEYVDNDISASKGFARPGYDALMAAVSAGELDRIILWQTSRLWRNRRERAEGIEVLRRAQVSVLACRGPDLDMTTAYGRAMTGLLGEFDTMESELASERIARAAQQRAEKGLYHGGRRAFGYATNGLDRVQAEADEVAAMYRKFLAGVYLAAIARDLNDRGVTTTSGGAFTSGAVADILRRARNAGLVERLGEIVGPGFWKRIVSEDDWRAAVRILSDPGRKTSTGNKAAYLLSGIARCGTCGGVITSAGVRARGKLRKIYRCRVSNCVGKRLDWIDEYVASLVVARLAKPDAKKLLIDNDRPDTKTLTAKARSLRSRLDEAAAAFADGEITRAQLRTASDRLRGQLAQVEAQQAHVSRVPILTDLVEADDVQAVWDGLPLARQRAVVACLMTVRLLRGGSGVRKFDSTLVEVTWTA